MQFLNTVFYVIMHKYTHVHSQYELGQMEKLQIKCHKINVQLDVDAAYLEN